MEALTGIVPNGGVLDKGHVTSTFHQTPEGTCVAWERLDGSPVTLPLNCTCGSIHCSSREDME